MSADACAHQIVCDEAVEDSAEELLDVQIDVSFQAKQRVRSYRVGWDNCGDQREPVGGRCDVAIGEAWPRKRAGGTKESSRCWRRNARARCRDVDHEWLELLALDDRQIP